MKSVFYILFLSVSQLLMAANGFSQKKVDHVLIDCFGEVMHYQFPTPINIDINHPSTEKEISEYCRNIPDSTFSGLVSQLKIFRDKLKIDDWLYYQLVRRAAEQIAPKANDYTLYTIYKWHLLSLSGYDAILTFADGKILFYVLSTENIYNIPIRKEGDKTYVCLNYHDYGKIDFKQQQFRKLDVNIPGSMHSFSYQVNSIPELKKDYGEKVLNFTYNKTEYTFKVKLNPAITTYFRNYPSTDYEKHFNIPLSRETYSSLIPSLKKYIKGLSPKDGVDFLMHFTRYSFLFRPDTEKFGMEKIYSPEMTLLNESSDCEDRVSLFYYLVKEMYDLPMIIVVYPKHVSVAVHFDKSFGETIEYKGRKFTICEPTPQEEDLRIGQPIPALSHTSYQIAFAYEPQSRKIKN